MSITSVIVVYAICWFMTFFIVLPLRFESQADAGSVVPGTPASAPSGEVVRRKAWITTIAATLVWAVICGIILSGWISVRDFDVRGVMPPLPADDETGG
jgi:predicted secreted protein